MSSEDGTIWDILNNLIHGKIDTNRRYLDQILEKMQEQNHHYYHKKSRFHTRFLSAILALIIVPLVQIMSLPFENASAESDKIFDVTKFGAKPNDSIGDTKNIANAIDSAIKNNGGHVYFPSGTYIISDTLKVKDAKNVVLYGTGTVKMGSTGKDLFNITNSHGIVVSDISIQGWQDGTKSELDANGDLLNGSGIRIGDNSYDITIEKCKIFNQNRDGISIEDVSDLDITNCEIFNTRTGIRLDTVSNATITDNYLHDHASDAMYVLGDNRFEDILVSDNTIKRFGDTAIDVKGSGSNIKLSGNDIDESTITTKEPNGLGVSISKTITNYQVISNSVTNVAVGMSLDGSNGTISDNEIQYNGIRADWTKIRVLGRYVVQFSDYKTFEQFGMSLGGHGLTVSYNTITSPSHIKKPLRWDLTVDKIRNYGIKVFGSNNLISDNSLSLYSDQDPYGSSETTNVLNYGIKIGGSASSVTVDSNTLHLMPGANYESVIEEGDSNNSCTQHDNVIIEDGKTKDLAKGF